MIYAGRESIIELAGDPISFTEEVMVNVKGDFFQIQDKTKRVWGYDSAISVFIDGELVSPSLYKVFRASGEVQFNPGLVSDGLVTVSGSFVTTSKLASVNAFDFTISKEQLDGTTFGDDLAKTVVGIRSGSGSFTVIDITNPFLLKNIDSDYMLLRFKPSKDSSFSFTSWVIVDSEDISAEITSVLNKNISFATTGDFRIAF